MASFIHRSYFNPLVDLGIIEFCFLGSKTDLFTRASDDDVSVEESTDRVTMASILHSPSVFELPSELVVVERLDQLTALEHAVWKSFVVTSSNHEDSHGFSADLDHLEVVREAALEVNRLM